MNMTGMDERERERESWEKEWRERGWRVERKDIKTETDRIKQRESKSRDQIIN